MGWEVVVRERWERGGWEGNFRGNAVGVDLTPVAALDLLISYVVV